MALANRRTGERRAALARGARAEDFVADRLVADGWQVLARNWRARGGELDLVVARDGAVRFVEVKARAEGDALVWEAISTSKRAKLVRAAEAWLAQAPTEPREACFLVAFVGHDGDAWSLHLIDDAFDGG